MVLFRSTRFIIFLAYLCVSVLISALAAEELPASFGALGMTQFADANGPRFTVDSGFVRLMGNGDGQRQYLRTVRTDFARQSFEAAVTVKVQGGQGAGCAFFGMGRGEGEAENFMEPSKAPALYCRLGPSDFAEGKFTIYGNGKELGTGAMPIGDGTHRVRFVWDATARRALYEVDANWDGKVFKADVSVNAKPVAFGESDAHLFLGGTQRTGFADLAVRLLSESEVANAGFGESFADDATAQTWLPQANTSAKRTANIANCHESGWRSNGKIS